MYIEYDYIILYIRVLDTGAIRARVRSALHCDCGGVYLVLDRRHADPHGAHVAHRATERPADRRRDARHDRHGRGARPRATPARAPPDAHALSRHVSAQSLDVECCCWRCWWRCQTTGRQATGETVRERRGRPVASRGISALRRAVHRLLQHVLLPAAAASREPLFPQSGAPHHHVHRSSRTVSRHVLVRVHCFLIDHLKNVLQTVLVIYIRKTIHTCTLECHD